LLLLLVVLLQQLPRPLLCCLQIVSLLVEMFT
jgi:hypothetical protein